MFIEIHQNEPNKMKSPLNYFYLLLIACFVACEQPSEKESSVEKIMELNISEGTNMAAALSPDGETLAIDALGRIWLMSKDGGEAVAITDSLGNARQPSWSPDGKQIAFQAYWEGNWHVYTVNRDGSGLKKLTDGEYDHREPHWSPDGTTLAFSSDRSGNYDIWTRDIIGERLVQLTDNEANEFGPAWSPDGTQMSYVSNDPESGGIMVRSMASGESKRVHQPVGAVSGVSWSPGGSRLSFNELNEANAQLKSVSIESGEVESLSAENEEAFPFRASWISEDSFIYTADGKIKRSTSAQISDVDFNAKIFIRREEYERKTRDFDSTEPQVVKGISNPKLSPDGQSIAFVALQDLWLRKPDGQLEQLTNDPYIQILPAWSPDGNTIAYSSDKDGPFAIWTYEIADGEHKKLFETGSSTSGMNWSPDSEEIAYTQSFGPRGGQLFTLNVTTGKNSPLGKRQSSSVGTPAWSSDGETIALSVLDPYSTLYREGVNRVMLFSKDGTSRPQKAEEHWSFGVRGNNGPIWSPDGKYMAAATRGNIWIVPVDQNGDAAAFPIKVTDELSDAPSWSGDSKEILYTATDKLKIVNIDSKSVRDIPIDLTWKRSHPTTKKVIHIGGLIDGISGDTRDNLDITIENHRITDISAHDENREADEKIDASDAFMIPGLIDIHTHEGSTFGEQLGRTWLSWGVTTIRNPSADPYDEINRKEAIQSGKAIGPRIYLTGSPIDGSRIYYGGAIALQSEEQIDMELNRAKLLDYDLIKTYVRLADPLQQRVVKGAHEIGIPVTSHELYPAVSYNTDGTEHVSGTSRIGYSSKISMLWNSYDDVTDMLAQSGMSFTPTTAIIAYKYLIDRDPSSLEDIRVKTFKNSGGNGIPGLMGDEGMSKESTEALYQNLIQMVTQVHQKGGFVVAGTDSPIIPYGLALHIELETYQDAGLTPFEILQTATVNNAKLLNAQNDLGTIEVGKIADLVILDKNPLEDIKHTRSTRAVIKNGEYYELESLLTRP